MTLKQAMACFVLGQTTGTEIPEEALDLIKAANIKMPSYANAIAASLTSDYITTTSGSIVTGSISAKSIAATPYSYMPIYLSDDLEVKDDVIVPRTTKQIDNYPQWQVFAGTFSEAIKEYARNSDKYIDTTLRIDDTPQSFSCFLNKPSHVPGTVNSAGWRMRTFNPGDKMQLTSCRATPSSGLLLTFRNPICVLTDQQVQLVKDGFDRCECTVAEARKFFRPTTFDDLFGRIMGGTYDEMIGALFGGQEVELKKAMKVADPDDGKPMFKADDWGSW